MPRVLDECLPLKSCGARARRVSHRFLQKSKNHYLRCRLVKMSSKRSYHHLLGYFFALKQTCYHVHRVMMIGSTSTSAKTRQQTRLWYTSPLRLDTPPWPQSSHRLKRYRPVVVCVPRRARNPIRTRNIAKHHRRASVERVWLNLRQSS